MRWLAPVRPGDELRLRVTVVEARRSRSKPDQGIVRSLVELSNQKGEVVMTLRPISFLRCRPGAEQALSRTAGEGGTRAEGVGG